MNIESELKNILDSEDAVQSGTEEYAIDGVVPSWVVLPSTAEQICRFVTLAVDQKLKAVPFGGGTQVDVGKVPERVDLVISTQRLKEVTYYNERDMTISAGAGMTLKELGQHVRSANLWFPVDPPHPDRVTLGGAVAANANGPLRFGKGPLRDHVIGLKVVSPEGKIVKAGGRVVKNVAGYDMCKLYTGSLGTLGIIVEVSLKLASWPETQAAMWAEVDGGPKTEELTAAMMNSDLEPLYIDLIRGDRLNSLLDGPLAGAGNPKAILGIGFEGGQTKTDWFCQTAEQMISDHGFRVTAKQTDSDALAAWSALAGVYSRENADVVLKASLLSSQVVEFIETSRSIAQSRSVDLSAASHIGNGIVYLFLRGKDSDLSDLSSTMLAEASRLDGNLVVQRAPAHLKPQLDIWGTPSGDWEIMRTIRRKFDPEEILNPARFISAA